jgi:hypothetical protein
VFERRIEPRHADGKPGRRHQFAAEPGDEIVIAPAAADRPEANGVAGLVGGVSNRSSASNTAPV